MAHPQHNFTSNFNGSDGHNAELTLNINGVEKKYTPAGNDQTYNVPGVARIDINLDGAELVQAIQTALDGAAQPVLVERSVYDEEVAYPYIGDLDGAWYFGTCTTNKIVTITVAKEDGAVNGEQIPVANGVVIVESDGLNVYSQLRTAIALGQLPVLSYVGANPVYAQYEKTADNGDLIFVGALASASDTYVQYNIYTVASNNTVTVTTRAASAGGGGTPDDENGFFNSSLYQTPGDGVTESLTLNDFRIKQGTSIHGSNIEFVPTHQEGGVDFGEVYLNPGTYILNIRYTLQWVGNPRGTFVPLVCRVGGQPFDFSFEQENTVITSQIRVVTARQKVAISFPFDADTPPMGIWVETLSIAQIASNTHPAVVHDTTLAGSGTAGSPLGVTTDTFGKVKDIPTSIGQFRNGDVIPVDGPNGPAKMEAETLLELTAQNALDGNVAPAFVPNETEAITGKLYVYGGQLYEAKEAYQGPWNANKFVKKDVGQFINYLLSELYRTQEHSGYLTGYNSFENDLDYHCLYTDVIQASEGDTFYYVGRGNAGAKSVIFFDSSKTIIGSATYISLETYKEIVCPADTSYVQFSSYDTADKDLTLCVMKKGGVLSYLVAPLADKKSVDDLHIINNIERSAGFLCTDGIWSVDAGYHSLYTDKIRATNGDKFLYCGHAESLAASAVFYNSNGAYISGVQVNSPDSYSEITCPANTAFVQFCSYEPSSKTPKLSVVKVNSQIYGVLKRLPDYLLDCVVYSVTEQDGYLISNGTYEGTGSYHSLTTGKIPASEGDVFFYKGNARASAKSVLFFNSANNIFRADSYEALAVAQRIVCPQNTAYVQFSSFDYKTNDVYMTVFKSKSQFGAMLANQTCDILTKSVWFACGDSFTAGDFSGVAQPNLPDGKYAGQKPVYPYYIGNRTLMDVRNIAVGGMTIAQPSDASFTNVFTKAGGLLYTTNFGAADYITLYFGINDCNKSIPIGTIDDDNNTTFYGAWNVVLDYLRTYYPFKHIGIIVTNGCVGHPEYPAAVEAVAKKWGINYLDLDGGVHCPTMVRCSSRNLASDDVKEMINNQQYVSNGNHHPNANAHLFESYFIESWLRTL